MFILIILFLLPFHRDLFTQILVRKGTDVPFPIISTRCIKWQLTHLFCSRCDCTNSYDNLLSFTAIQQIMCNVVDIGSNLSKSPRFKVGDFLLCVGILRARVFHVRA